MNEASTATELQTRTKYQYDQGGAGAFALGRLTSVADPSGSESYSYNSMGWMTQLQKTVGTIPYPILYGYNAGGQVTQITYPSGRVVQQTPDSIGRLQTVASGGTNYVSISSPSGYNAAGQVLSMNYGNGVIANVGYSSSTSDEMTSLSYSKGANTLFNLNYYYQNVPTNCTTGATGNNGQIQCIVDVTPTAITPGAPGRTVSYTYDPLGRLATAVTTGSTQFAKWGIAETYDRYGNRLNQAATSGSPPTNNLTFATTPAPPTNPPGGAYTNRPDGFSFDASGNMLNDGINTLAYDAENCLTSNTNSSTGTTYYTCDAAGVRVKKALQAGTTTVYIFDGDLDIAEYNNGTAPGSPSREFLYAGSDLVASITGTNTIYHHKDHLSVRLNTDGNGQVTGQEATYPFGESWYSSSAPDQFMFTSYQRDSESGNDYAMARYYINRFGRFSCVDPLMGNPLDPQSWNRYAYVRNDPINITDPSGQSWVKWLVDALVVAAAILLPEIAPELFGEVSAVSMETVGTVDGPVFSSTGAMTTTTNVLAGMQFSTAPNFGLLMMAGASAASGSPQQPQPSLKQRLSDDLKKSDCAKMFGGPKKANQILSHFKGITNVDNPSNVASNASNDQFGDAKAAIDSGNAVAQTPVPINEGGSVWNGTNFNTYVGARFMGYSLSARETVVFHEFMHVARGTSKIAKYLVDMKTANVPGMAANRTANIYDISRNCGTALPPEY